MKKKVLWITEVLVLLALVLVLTGCGGNKGKTASSDSGEKKGESVKESSKADEDLFIWEGNTITGLTEKGKKQKKIVIPARCEKMEGFQMFGEAAAEEVSFEDEHDLDLVYAFFEAPNLQKVDLPEELSRIYEGMLCNCDKLEEIVIPAEVVSVDNGGFDSCGELKKVTFEGTKLTELGEDAFRGCRKLEELNLPEGLQKIGPNAFSYCDSLKSLTLPASVNSVKGTLIYDSGITEVHLPKDIQLEGLGSGTFQNFADGKLCTVYIVKDSWMDQNKELMGDAVIIKYEE